MDDGGTAQLLARVREAKRRRAWAEAEGMLTAALAERPGDLGLRASYADLLWRRGDLEEALALADALLRERPGYAPALVVRGIACLRLRRPAAAAEALEAAWAARPSPYVAAWLARARAEGGDPDGALAFVRAARRTFPEDPGLRAEEARLLERLGRPREAVAAWGEEGPPGEPHAFAAWVRARLASRPPEAALTEVEGLLRLERHRTGPLLAERARLLEALGRDREAVAAWEETVAAEPTNAYFRRRLAFAQRRAGDRERGYESLKRALELDPSDVAALSALVADARALRRQQDAADFLVSLVRQHPGRRSLWGWVRRLRADGA